MPDCSNLQVEVERSSFDRFVVCREALLALSLPRGLIVTACARPEEADKFQFVSRFFDPSLTDMEDPVTGSAHCALQPYWAAKGLAVSDGWLTGYQASPRGGFVSVNGVAHPGTSLLSLFF